MSITDDVRSGPRPPGGPPPDDRGPGDGGFDRTPPQDVAAEQSVLGGMLLSKDAIADVVEILKAQDFYKPAHVTIFEAVIDLYGRGEPADAVTVAAALADSGDLARIGGAAYLHTLMASVPTAANAAYYARIVGERAVLRRLVEAGTRIVQLGYGTGAGAGRDVDDVVDLAQQAVYDVTERRVSEDFAVLADMLQPTLDEIEAVGAQGGMMTGVPTGFTDLDRLLNGLHAGQLIIVAGRPGLGKALALDTPLPTPDGWTTMGEVKVGDRLIGADGRPTTVTHAFDVMNGRPCYEVVFSDGSVIVADAEHLWLTSTRSSRKNQGGVQGVATTAKIAGTLRDDSGRTNHAVRAARSLTLPERDDLPIPPYTLGVWLGDGHSDAARFTTVDPEIVAYVESDGFTVRESGPTAYTHVPTAYLRASESQRRALLAGLLDTAGTVARAGNVRYRSTSRRLAEDVHDLVIGLGYRATITTKAVKGRTSASSVAYTLNFSATDPVFRLERKNLAHKERRRTQSTARTGSRHIVDVRPIPSVPVRCVTVDNADHLYLAGRSMIPTHNSTAAMDFARSASVKNNLASAIFSLEMSKVEIVMRLLSAEARVPLHVLRSGQLSDDDWTKLARRMGEISEAPLFVDDTPNMNLMEIRAKARRLRQRHDLKLIVVDYLQLMSSPKRVESRQQEVSELSRGLKLLAKEVECPVIAVSQLNRGPEQRTDKRPQLSDLRESGCLTADTTLLRADTGAPITFAALLRDGWDGVMVWSLDEHRRMVPAPITNVFPSGVKQTYRLLLASGREVKASGNHPFLTFTGWRSLTDLTVGARIAIPRRTPPPLSSGIDWSTERIGLLAHLVGDGCVGKKQPVHYTSQDAANLAFVEAAARSEFGIIPRRVAQENRHHVYLPAPHTRAHGRGNPLYDWFRELGISNRRSYEKRIPDVVYGANEDQIAVFLRHLWATDGNITLQDGKSAAKVYYASTSRELADGVIALLSRFGIMARLKVVSKAHRPSYHVVLADEASLRTFCRDIGVYGSRGETAVRLLADIEDRKVNTTVDTQPLVGGLDADVPRAAGSDAAGSDAGGSDDVFWDRVVAIEELGAEAVYDATVKGSHNFIADGIVAHNSIEQDADVVILLHRDDYYDKESPRAGEADFIVAKHRNGPTDTITVAAQLHLSRFVDMAIV